MHKFHIRELRQIMFKIKTFKKSFVFLEILDRLNSVKKDSNPERKPSYGFIKLEG